MPEMIDREMLLDAVHELAIVTAATISSIANQDVDRRIQRQNRLGACDDGFRIRQLQRHR